MVTRYIKKDIKKNLISKYNMKCANLPNSNVIQNYNCPMWKLYNGNFDESGYEIDHINEFAHSYDNSINNLQLLCICCHKVKTNLFAKNKYLLTTSQIINNGAGLMDIQKNIKKRKI